MNLYNARKYISEGKAIISAEVECRRFPREQTVFFSYPERFYDYLPHTADPFFPALLIPAMMWDDILEIEPPVSCRIMENQQIIQDIFSTWHPNEFRRVEVIAQCHTNNNLPRKKANATFFSLGVDSMYSMLKYLPQNNPPVDKQLTTLIYMKGLELPLSIYANGQAQGVINNIEKVSAHYGLDFIVGETNIRDVFPLDWEDHYFGPGLASTALSLSNGFRNIYIPSSHSYAIFFHDPSSPLIDNHWSNENTNIFHDGAEKERVGKIADLIIKDKFALSHLRVCVNNEGGDYNCGKCWKCIRTMITLEILGQLETCRSFPSKLPRHFSSELRTYNPDSLEFTRENLRLAKKLGKKDLEAMLEREIRVGSFDVFRNGKSLSEFFKELVYYFYVKAAKKSGFIS
jgi:hypothetical protein